jgi:TonB family protein
MRRIILTALVLLPVLAHAQASQTSTATAGQLQAKVAPPAGIRPATAPKAATTAPAADASEVMVPVSEHIIERNAYSLESTDSGSISYTVLGGDPVIAAKLVQTTPIALSLKELRSETLAQPVVVHLTVDKQGLPRNLTVLHSAGAAIDKRALTAVSQYRFKPATQDGLPIESVVTVEIKISATN